LFFPIDPESSMPHVSSGLCELRPVHIDSWTTIFWRSNSAAATMFLFITIRKRACVTTLHLRRRVAA
jgi:hypothetical protein